MRITFERLHRNWCSVGIAEFHLAQRTDAQESGSGQQACPSRTVTALHRQKLTDTKPVEKLGGTIIPRQAENSTQNRGPSRNEVEKVSHPSHLDIPEDPVADYHQISTQRWSSSARLASWTRPAVKYQTICVYSRAALQKQ